MESRHLRILHTVSPSSTYILARSPAPISIQHIVENADTSPEGPRFARVSLKTCIDFICDSSSELFHDATRDYSVYSMDPLESLAQRSVASSSSSSAPAVSVACGRLSSIRSLNDQGSMVIGTLMKDMSLGQEALEVVFLLTQTIAPQKVPDPTASSRIDAAIARQKIEKVRAARKQKPKDKPRAASKPLGPTQADRILKQFGDGYSLEPGDPKGKLKSLLPTPPSSQPSETVPPQPNLTPQSLAVLEMFKDDPRLNQVALINVVSLIDSATKQKPELSVAEALKLLAPVPPPKSQYQTQTPSTSENEPLVPTDDSVVALDKENVKPTALQKYTNRVAADAKLVESSASNPLPSNSSPEVAASLIQSILSSTTLNPAPSNSAPTSRKRTISEVLGGDYPSSSSSFMLVRPFRQGGLPWSSPPRVPQISPSGLSKDRPIVIPDSPSPSKPLPSGSRSKPKPKPYTFPDWARTETALQPRISEEAQQALRAKQIDGEQRKREERAEKRLKWLQQKNSRTGSGKGGGMHRTLSTPAVFSTVAGENSDEQVLTASKSLMAPPPLILPIIAATLPSPSHTRSPPRSPLSNSNSILHSHSGQLPRTPPRRRAMSFSSPVVASSACPEDEDGEELSLFTPRAGGSNEIGVEMNTPFTPRRDLKSNVFESPSPSKKTSNARSRAVPNSNFNEEREQSTSTTPPPSSEPVTDGDSDQEEEEDLLTKELNSALEEAGTDGKLRQGEDGDIEFDSRPFWPGLPSSSPPSSPMLQPVINESNDRDVDEELPMPSSDFDFEEMSGIDSRSPQNIDNRAGVAEGDVAHFDETALAAIAEMLVNGNNSDDSPEADSESDFIAGTDSGDDSGDIFKALGAVPDLSVSFSDAPDGSPQDANIDLDSILSGFPSFPIDVNLDNSSFWGAVGPILEHNQTHLTTDPTMGGEGLEAVEDPVKKLLSGCVL